MQVRREPAQGPQLLVQPEQGVRGVLGHGLVLRAAGGGRVRVLQDIVRDRREAQQARGAQRSQTEGKRFGPGEPLRRYSVVMSRVQSLGKLWDENALENIAENEY